MNAAEAQQPRRVLVTGASGRLGRTVAARAHAEGHHVVGTDLREAGDVSYRFEQADLCDHRAALGLLTDIDAVLHIGNHAGVGALDPQVAFNENVAMNLNVFQGAAEQGVGRIVFASTLQVIGSHIDRRTVVNEPARPAYPISGATPADPSNVYALSKTVSETMLRYYAQRCGIGCVSLRFPLLHNGEERLRVSSGQESFTDLIEGFSGLTYDDAADLFTAILASDVEGYRVYMPGVCHRHRDLGFADLLRTHYPDVPGSVDDLIDFSDLTADTGWQPKGGYRR